MPDPLATFVDAVLVEADTQQHLRRVEVDGSPRVVEQGDQFTRLDLESEEVQRYPVGMNTPPTRRDLLEH